MVWAQIAMAGAGALSSYLAAGKAEKSARKRFAAEQKRLEEQLEQSKYKTSSQLKKLERFTAKLQRKGTARDPFMEQAILAGGRRTVAAETERQQGAAGMTGAARIRSAQMVAGAQAQGLLAVESTRQKREIELNQLVSQNMAKAADVSQAGYAVEAQTRTQLTAARTNLMMAQEQASSQRTGALISGFAGMAAAGIEAYGASTSDTPDTPDTSTDSKLFDTSTGDIGAMEAAQSGTLQNWGKNRGDVLSQAFGSKSPGGQFFSQAKDMFNPEPSSWWNPSSW